MSKIIVRKNLIVFNRSEDWENIKTRLIQEYGGRIMISWVMKRELGFTVRTHQEWVEFDKTGDRPRYYMDNQIHLDFFNESAQSWFQLKYMNL